MTSYLRNKQKMLKSCSRIFSLSGRETDRETEREVVLERDL